MNSPTLHNQDCESFAGPINWLDCTEGPDSCYAYVEDDCVYTGERIGEEGGQLCLKWIKPLETKYSHQRQTSPMPETWRVSRVAECGQNSGQRMESLSSTTTRPRRSATCIAPSMLTASRWADPRLLLPLTNARQQQQQQRLLQPHLQQQLVL